MVSWRSILYGAFTQGSVMRNVFRCLVVQISLRERLLLPRNVFIYDVIALPVIPWKPSWLFPLRHSTRLHSICSLTMQSSLLVQLNTLIPLHRIKGMLVCFVIDTPNTDNILAKSDICVHCYEIILLVEELDFLLLCMI